MARRVNQNWQNYIDVEYENQHMIDIMENIEEAWRIHDPLGEFDFSSESLSDDENKTSSSHTKPSFATNSDSSSEWNDEWYASLRPPPLPIEELEDRIVFVPVKKKIQSTENRDGQSDAVVTNFHNNSQQDAHFTSPGENISSPNSVNNTIENASTLSLRNKEIVKKENSQNSQDLETCNDENEKFADVNQKMEAELINSNNASNTSEESKAEEFSTNVQKHSDTCTETNLNQEIKDINAAAAARCTIRSSENESVKLLEDQNLNEQTFKIKFIKMNNRGSNRSKKSNRNIQNTATTNKSRKRSNKKNKKKSHNQQKLCTNNQKILNNSNSMENRVSTKKNAFCNLIWRARATRLKRFLANLKRKEYRKALIGKLLIGLVIGLIILIFYGLYKIIYI